MVSFTVYAWFDVRAHSARCRLNPHEKVPQTEAARTEERRRRVVLGIPAYTAVQEERCEIGLGAAGAVGYQDDSPFTTYQMRARGDTQKVTGHYTSSFKSSVFVER